ncbi:Transposon Tf2-1 polyprotein [Ceratobasidium theobromae]|uniref:Transposon Tf2-1 polyprotein n=1 Tax=Ceratobasidium theobromae TaxID=1582974 RepID=A0A5N5Q9F4_9AGAM|nr:Transposon Tf2-1 polyprotein [Ceratobasidium theobromae]
MFDDPPPQPPLGGYLPEDPDPYSYDDNSSDHRPPPRRPRPPPGPPGSPGPPVGPDPYVNQAAAQPVQPFRPAPVHFNTKLKSDLIPEWDSDPKVLPKWVIAVNNIAEYSEYARQQLGQQVPLQFTGRAQQWFTALNQDTRRNITQDWPSLRQVITIHFMNHAYLEQNKCEALEMKYRDSSHRNETPEDYVICKMEALTLFNDWTDPELIFQIMNDAPSSWRAYIDTEDIRLWEEFLDKIYWHQQDLMSGALSNQPDISNLVEAKPPWKKKNKPIGWHKDNPKPQFCKHDKVVSKGKTPKDKGARGCCHCGSLNHWDRDCPEAKNNSHFVHSHMAEVDDEVWQALDDYEEVCNKTYCEEENEELPSAQETSESSSEEQDFPEPLQSLAASASSQEAQVGIPENQTTLEGTTPDEMGTQYASPVTSNFQGPVKMLVEAYVVPKMNTPFILGTDFATQFQLSLQQDQNGTKIIFGETGRSIPVIELESTPRINSNGHSFQVEVAQGFVNNSEKFSRARKRYRLNLKDKLSLSQGTKVRIYQTVTIDPHSVKMVKVKTQFEEGQSEGFLDCVFNSHKTEQDIFAISDCLISRNNPKIQITNLSDKPIWLQGGEIIGYMHDPKAYLAKEEDLDSSNKEDLLKYAKLVKVIAQQKAEERPEDEDPILTLSPEGGPKTAELPNTEAIPWEELLTKLNFAETLSKDQKSKLEQVIIKHRNAFSLEGRLGNYNAKVEINLHPGTTEISLPPYSASPAKREIIDTQIDTWLKLEVIEPSKSA